MFDPPQKTHFAAVVLAAGRSIRMGGTHKLLLPFRGKPVIQHVIHALAEGGVNEIVVVTGFEAEKLQSVIFQDVSRVVLNQEFERGMSTSIRCGLNAFSDKTDACFIVPGDMPLLNSPLVQKLIVAYRAAKKPTIVVPLSRGLQGNPVLFSRHFFPALRQLDGDRGAKGLFENWQKFVITCEIEDEAILFDLDTPEDYRLLLKMEK